MFLKKQSDSPYLKQLFGFLDFCELLDSVWLGIRLIRSGRALAMQLLFVDSSIPTFKKV